MNHGRPSLHVASMSVFCRKECAKMNNSLFSDDLKFTLLDQSEIISESILFMGSSFYRELFIFAHSLQH